MLKLAARELRNTTAKKSQKTNLKKNPVYVILDNVLDTYNVGAIFRLADAISVTKIILCGKTETPPNTRIKKASINTTEWVDWEYAKSTELAIKKLKKENSKIRFVAVEQNPKSVLYNTYDYQFPVALIVGHETSGVPEKVLAMCDGIVELPMWGVNISLNVMVSLGIVLYEVMKHYEKK